MRRDIRKRTNFASIIEKLQHDTTGGRDGGRPEIRAALL